MVRQQAGTGSQIVSCYQGTSPDGLDAWVITVSVVTNTEEPKYVTYYAGYQFCYPAE